MRLTSISCALALCVLAAPARSQDLPSDGATLVELRALFARYRCPIEDRLRRLYYAGDPAVDRDRFIAVTLRAHRHGYVQCLFHDDETKMLCEAASGFYYDPPGSPRTVYVPAANIAALGRLGFSTDGSQGNFSLDIDVAKPVDFGGIAEAILSALFYGYDARADMTLDLTAPFAPGFTSACDPVS